MWICSNYWDFFLTKYSNQKYLFMGLLEENNFFLRYSLTAWEVKRPARLVNDWHISAAHHYLSLHTMTRCKAPLYGRQ